MTTPLCPRCNAPLMLDGSTTCACSTCAYGHDAPRAMVPQPDVIGVAPVRRFDPITYRSMTGAIGAQMVMPAGREGEWVSGADYDALAALVTAQPAPTPQRTDAGGMAPLESAIAEVLGGPSEYGAQWSARLIHTMLVRDGWVKQPAPTPAANAYPCPHGRANFNACPHCMGLNQYGPPSETVTTTATVTDATSAGADEGMVRELRDLIAKTEWEAGRPGSVYPGCEFQEELAEAAARAILATHDIVRRPQ